MEHDSIPAYGLWSLAIINSAVFIIFAFSFFKPNTKRDWRSFSAFSAFIVALFVEMYGFPLTIFLLSGWLQKRAPGLDLMSHDAGHLWETIFGIKGDPHFNVLHILSNVLIFGGFLVLGSAWRVLYRAQRVHQLATSGVYARMRHPQYVGFILIMAGFLVQWPTLLTLAMFPILVVMYVRLALHEEAEAAAEFGNEWFRYARNTPRFFPKLGQISDTSISRREDGSA
jgi:protein-S-isoprenylcysteine O-methyltransferase Ste14